MKIIKLCAGFLFCGIMFFALSAPAENKVITAARTDSAPVIDGRLTDACWQKAQPVENFIELDARKPARFQTLAYVLYDDENLYIGFKCIEPEVKNIQRNEDCIEIMLCPWSDRKDEYFHFIVPASGSNLYDSFCSQDGFVHDPKWDGEWKAETFIGENFWSAEVSIPYYTLGINRAVTSTWRINLMREKKAPFAENSSIAEDGAFHVAGKFARLEGFDVNFAGYRYQAGFPQLTSAEIKNEQLNALIGVPIENQTGKEQKVKLQCWLVDPGQKPRIKAEILTLAPDKEIKTDIGPFQLGTSGEYDCYVILSDPVTPLKIFHRSKSKMQIDYVPMSIQILEPFYRDAIFASQNLKEVVLQVTSRLPEKEMKDKSLVVGINEKEKGVLISGQTFSSPVTLTRVIFPADKLPYGELLITAELKDGQGKTIARTEHGLKKLAPHQGEVWLGSDGNWRVDGVPFFFNGSWGYLEDSNQYYNVVWYNVKGKKRARMLYYSGHNSQLKAEKLGDKIINYTKAEVKKHKDDPNFFGYHTADEPAFPVKNLEEIYRIIKEEDPYHPVIITHNDVGNLCSYFNAADFHTFHTYPNIYKDKRMNDLSRIGICIEKCVKFNAGRKFIGTLIQSFNYGDYGMINNRIDNYQEFRTKLHLAIVGGAKGILFFNRGYSHYPELYIGAPHLAQEFDCLSKAILAPDSKLKVQSNSETLKTRLKCVQPCGENQINTLKGFLRKILRFKESEGQLYLFSVNAGMEPKEVTITIPGLSKVSSRLNVISENREVKIKQDSFTDKFDVYETHVYTTSKEKTGLLSIKEIEQKLAEVNQARRKPGNLAFQYFEGDGVEVSASSNAGGSRRPDNLLWHLVDGIVDKKWTVWSDKTPNEYPDWVEIKLPAAHVVSRVVVYPPDGALKDYQIQAFETGNWKTVDTISGNTNDVITHKFTPVTTDRIRIWITAANGPNSKISEVEIYEK